MIGAVPPDYAATFFNVIDEDAALAAANAERLEERAGSKQDSRAEEGGQETVHTVEEEPNALRRASMPFNCIDDSLQEMELERCLYLADGATCRARMFCLILAKRAASDGGSMDSSLPAELWLHCAVMCPITTVQKWVRCRFADWVVASDENWHSGYDGLLNEHQLARAKNLKRKPRGRLLPSDETRLIDLECLLSHDQWEPVDNRDALWAELAELLLLNPSLRTILNVPEEAATTAELWVKEHGYEGTLCNPWARMPLYELVPTAAEEGEVIDKWEHAERIVARRSNIAYWEDGHIARWDAHCGVQIAHFLRQQRVTCPLFTGDSHDVKQLGCMRDGFPANMNAATAEEISRGGFIDWTFFASTTRTRRSTARSLASLPSTGTNHVPPPNTVAAKSCTRPTVWLARTRPAASWWATSFALASRRWSGKSSELAFPPRTSAFFSA